MLYHLSYIDAALFGATRFRAIMALIAGATIAVPAAGAQGSRAPELRVGIGTFLTRDRGWNYRESMEFFATLAQPVGPVRLEVGGSLFTSFAKFAYPAISPLPPGPVVKGAGARVHATFPRAERSRLNALVGAEIVHRRRRTAEEAPTDATTLAAAGGIGVNVGPTGRGALELRYVHFAKRLGSSRGMLPLSFAWRF